MCGLIHCLKKTLIRGSSPSTTRTAKHSLSTTWKEKENRGIWVRHKGFGREDGELVGHRKGDEGYNTVRRFFLFLSSRPPWLVWCSGSGVRRRRKALTSERSVQNKKITKVPLDYICQVVYLLLVTYLQVQYTVGRGCFLFFTWII